MANWIEEADVNVHLRTITSQNHATTDVTDAITKAQGFAEPYLRTAFSETTVKAWTTTTCPQDIKDEVAALAASRILNEWYDEPLHSVQGGSGTAYGLRKNALAHFEKYMDGRLIAVDSAGDNLNVSRGAIQLASPDVPREFKKGTTANPEKFNNW